MSKYKIISDNSKIITQSKNKIHRNKQILVLQHYDTEPTTNDKLKNK